MLGTTVLHSHWGTFHKAYLLLTPAFTVTFNVKIESIHFSPHVCSCQKVNKFSQFKPYTIIHMRLQLKTKNGRKLRIFFMKRIRGAGCVVRVTGPTDRRGESVTAERETAPVDTFQAGQILSVIAGKPTLSPSCRSNAAV